MIMSSVTTTPPSRRPHAFINHSPESYEAKVRPDFSADKRDTSTASEPESKQTSTPISVVSFSRHPSSASSASSSAGSQSDSESGEPSGSQNHNESFSDSSQSHHSHSNREKDAPRKRRRTSPDELQILETEFSYNSKPCKEDRERIANLTSMDEKAVQVWFQNKRQSCRRQKSQGNTTTPHLVRTHSMPAVFQDENTFQFGVHPINMPHKAPFGNVSNTSSSNMASPAMSAQNISSQSAFMMSHHKAAKSLKLSMSADGKAELVERSPLKQISANRPIKRENTHFNSQNVPSAMKYATMPSALPNLSGVEKECASSLLFLKSGRWR